MMFHLGKRARYNIILFLLSFIYIFVIGLFGGVDKIDFVYGIVISFIYFFSFLTIREESRFSFSIPTLMVLLTWIGAFFGLPVLTKITGLLATLFFFVVIFLLVLRIASSSKVQLLEFVESVNIYLLLGIAASLLFRSVYAFNPQAYNTPAEGMSGMSDFIYFSFVTLTTLGYGDISPASPLARSLANLFSVTGQLYLTMIIAMLVGKFLSEKQSDGKDQ